MKSIKGLLIRQNIDRQRLDCEYYRACYREDDTWLHIWNCVRVSIREVVREEITRHISTQVLGDLNNERH